MTTSDETAATVPNPGSSEAVESGCTCPVLDNGRGRGALESEDGKPMFWITAGCPLHSIPMMDRLLEAVMGKDGGS